VTDQQTTVLYVLTTLAQSCAALAAFVGAVGVFRIQMLREQRRDAERDVRAWTGRLTSNDMITIPLGKVFETLAGYATVRSPYQGIATDAKSRRERTVPLLQGTRHALLLLEGWNLAVILFALVGFSYVPALAVAPWFSSILIVAAVVTALVPFGCVWDCAPARRCA